MTKYAKHHSICLLSEIWMPSHSNAATVIRRMHKTIGNTCWKLFTSSHCKPLDVYHPSEIHCQTLADHKTTRKASSFRQ